jgi:uncharacterized membrane protein
MSILKELDELIGAEVVTTETAEKIRDYYKLKSKHSGNKFFVVFGILGAILVGLGLILIIAHNWDDLSKGTKVFFAYAPLVIAQLFCAFTLWRKPDSTSWKEASSAFLFCAVGASISLVSQVYNIHGDLPKFLMIWMMLCLPVVYLMKSSMASLLYIAGVSYYCWESNRFFHWDHHESYNYWWMLLLIVPHYYLLVKNKHNSNFTVFHNWVVPISLTVCLGSVANHADNIMYISYMCLFGFFYILGTSPAFTAMKRNVNGYLVIGSLGTTQILLNLSFNHFWTRMVEWHSGLTNWENSPELYSAIIIGTLALGLLVYLNRNGINEFHPMKILFLIFVPVFIIGVNSHYTAMAIINALVLAAGLFTIWNGVRNDHLGVLNYGLLTITALIICRFFDSHMSFVIRGILFVLVGVGFFVTNYLMLRKRKQMSS